MSEIKVQVGRGAKTPYIHPLEAHFRFMGAVHHALCADRWAQFDSLTSQDIDSLLAQASEARV